MVIVLNFGSQFAHLIARRVRDLGVKAEILPFDASVKEILTLKPQGVIFSGGPASVTEKGSPRPAKEIFSLGLPVLGICYGEQVMAEILGGKVKRGLSREYGREAIAIKERDALFRGLKKKEIVWFSHGDQVAKLPKDFVRIARTAHCANAGIAHRTKPFYGIQFHPEVSHTEHGTKILSNFIFKICRARKDWEVKSFAKEIRRSIQAQVGKEHVVIGISGGVDSLVAATLLHQAIGKGLRAIFVDTGLLRKDEGENVTRALKAQGFKNLIVAHAEHIFLRRLKSVLDPEKKRKIIGHTFIEVFEDTIQKRIKAPIGFLAQGTIYPDRIESRELSKHAAKIKSHHNLTLPKKMGFKILEPLRDLYKDEVRKLGTFLGLPRRFLMRHPFPGPGLAIRIVGEVTPERLRILREADFIFTEKLQESGEYGRIWQAFAALLPVKTVGVMGDARTYEYVVSLRAVDSVDGMTADWHKMPQDLLEAISNSIVRSVRGVNRVVYDITQKPPATIEYE